MQHHHYLMMFLVFVVGYLVGARMPAAAQKIGLA